MKSHVFPSVLEKIKNLQSGIVKILMEIRWLMW